MSDPMLFQAAVYLMVSMQFENMLFGFDEARANCSHDPLGI
jgi:hypothetical protein